MINPFTKISVLIIAAIGCVYSVVAIAEESTANQMHVHVHVRALAATCAACHGTQGNTMNVSGQKNLSGKPVKLAGIDADYFTEQMFAFRSDQRIGTVMNHHAKGLNDAEIIALGQYFSDQKHQTVILPQQPLLKLQAH